MFNYKGIPCAYPYCCGVDLVKPGYPNKLVLKLTVSLLLLWLWSVHDHLPVFIWLWLSLSLLHKSLKEHSLRQSTYSIFISGIKRLLINGSCCFFNFSTLYAMKHWFEFKHRLFVLVIIFHIFQLWWGRNQSWRGGRAILYPGFVDQVCDLIQFFGLITVLYLSLRINITWFPSWKKHKA